MEPNEIVPLWAAMRAGDLTWQYIANPKTRIALADLRSASSIAGGADALESRSVLIATQSQLAAALCLVELDGVARRLVICPPDLAAENIPAVIKDAEIDAIVSDREQGFFPDINGADYLRWTSNLEKTGPRAVGSRRTDWTLFTSGTTGTPKMVLHTLSGLAGAIKPVSAQAPQRVWATFYDMRRYGGMQIFLRAMLGNCSFILSSGGEPLNDHLERLGAGRVTNISGTPSHWRRVLMSPAAHKMAPSYVRLSGEIADQGVRLVGR